MSQALVLAVDQGTTNTKALLLNAHGACVHRASRPLDIAFPHPAWVEQDAAALWRSVHEVVTECLEAAHGAEIAAVGISNQRESVVAWDRVTGKPVGPCLIWQCRRTADFCQTLKDRGLDATLRAKTGLPLDPLFSASKMRWLLDAAPHGADICLGTVDSWLLWQLTGGEVHATDHSNASRTLLLNLTSVDWDEELLGIFGVPRTSLPKLHASRSRHGVTNARSGLPAGILIGAMVGDSHAALFGQGAFAPGAVKATYGTGSSLMTLTRVPVSSAGGLASTIAWSNAAGVNYALEGNILATGSAVEWFAKFLGLNGAEDVERLAANVEDTEGVSLVPAFVGLGAPYWSPNARGLISGLTRGSTAAHVALATLRSIAFQVRDVFELMEREGGAELPELLADGGASRNARLMQFQADILDRAVVCGGSPDVSALGAGWMAGLTAGVWQSFDELTAQIGPRTRYLPSMDAAERTRLLDEWHVAVGRSRIDPGVK
jgi:glycerol kinase